MISRRCSESAQKKAPTIEWERVEAVGGIASSSAHFAVSGLVYCDSHRVSFVISPDVRPQFEATTGEGLLSWQFQESEQVEAVPVWQLYRSSLIWRNDHDSRIP